MPDGQVPKRRAWSAAASRTWARATTGSCATLGSQEWLEVMGMTSTAPDPASSRTRATASPSQRSTRNRRSDDSPGVSVLRPFSSVRSRVRAEASDARAIQLGLTARVQRPAGALLGEVGNGPQYRPVALDRRGGPARAYRISRAGKRMMQFQNQCQAHHGQRRSRGKEPGRTAAWPTERDSRRIPARHDAKPARRQDGCQPLAR